MFGNPPMVPAWNFAARLALTVFVPGALVLSISGKRRRFICVAALIVVAFTLFSCGGGGGGGSSAPQPNTVTTPPGSYRVTVTATTGSLQHSVQVTLVVN